MTRQLRLSFERTITLDPLEEYDGTIFENYPDYSEYIQNHFFDSSFKIVCRFNEPEDIDSLFEGVWFIEDVCLIVEEANLYFDPHSKIDSFRKLVAQGRHRRVSLLCVSQRVPELPIQFRAQRNTIVSFQQTEPYDLKLLEAYGFDPEEVKNLESSKGSDSLIEGTHFLYVGEPPFENDIQIPQV